MLEAVSLLQKSSKAFERICDGTCDLLEGNPIEGRPQTSVNARQANSAVTQRADELPSSTRCTDNRQRVEPGQPREQLVPANSTLLQMPATSSARQNQADGTLLDEIAVANMDPLQTGRPNADVPSAGDDVSHGPQKLEAEAHLAPSREDQQAGTRGADLDSNMSNTDERVIAEGNSMGEKRLAERIAESHHSSLINKHSADKLAEFQSDKSDKRATLCLSLSANAACNGIRTCDEFDMD